MYTFKDLRKASKLIINGNQERIAVLGNCSTQFFSTSIQGYSKLSGLNVEIYDADYNQIDALLFDSSSEVYKFQPSIIILWLATNKLYEDFLDMPLQKRASFAEIYLTKIENYWKLIENNCGAKIIQLNFSELNDNVLGQYSNKVVTTFTYQIRKLNFILEESMSQNINVYPIDLLSIQIRLGQGIFYDSTYYYKAKMSVSFDALPYIASAITDVIKSMSGKIKKCIILDLDNTLWGGIIGDDGIHNIEIGELGRGHVFTNFQRWLKQLKEYGIILAVCSKNNEDIAKEPFISHDEMILRLNDISIFVANWDDKVTNIKIIQETLNIGMDSIVFIDDSPFERNLVKNAINDIDVPELPEDPAHYLEFLQNCNYFDTVTYTGFVLDRTKLYQNEFERKKQKAFFSSINDYLKSLNMVGYAGAFEESRYSRIAELSQRSNQFNLRTIRYTEDEIRRISESDDYLTIYYTLKDKYGDYGLVGVIIIEKKSENEAFIDTWFMSCRVLKRGMEEYIMNKTIEKAKEKGFSKITAEYIPTKKNMMVKDIYSKMGFNSIDENRFEINVNDYEDKKVFILEE